MRVCWSPLCLYALSLLLSGCFDGSSSNGASAGAEKPGSTPGDNALLQSLTVEDGALQPAFDQDTFDYSIAVPSGTDSVSVSAEASDPAASITIAGDTATSVLLDQEVTLTEDPQTVTVMVTAEDKQTTRDYVISIEQLPVEPDLALVRITVLDDEGFAVPNALLETAAGETATTDSQGRAELEAMPGNTAIIRATGTGYATQVKRAALPDDQTSADIVMALKRLEAPITLTGVENGGSVTGVDGTFLGVPAGAIVDEQGNPVTGDIEVFLSPVDVSDERAFLSFPGEFEGLGEDGEQTLIATLGVADFTFSQDGSPVFLAEGQTADIRIPAYITNGLNGSPLAAGETIPLWFLDEETGLWQEEGAGTLVSDANSPSGFSLEAEVTHFSWWNIDLKVPGTLAELTISCFTPQTPCNPQFSSDLTVSFKQAETETPGFERRAFIRSVSGVISGLIPANMLLDITAEGGDGSWITESIPEGPFSAAVGETLQIELVIKPRHEGGGRFVPGTRLRGQMESVGETHDYLFESRGSEVISLVGYAADNVVSPVGTTGGLAGRITVLDEAGVELGTAIFDATGTANLSVRLSDPGDYRVRVSAEGKVPGWYLVTTTLGAAQAQQQYVKEPFARGSVALDGSVMAVRADGVVVFERVPAGWVNVARFRGLGPSSRFGFDGRIALDGDLLVVGAPLESIGADGIFCDPQTQLQTNGAVYVYRRQDNGVWQQEACLTAPNAEITKRFGDSVSVSGDTIAVGAGNDKSLSAGIDADQTDDSGSTVGAAFVYERNQAGNWEFQAYIKSEEPASQGRFGGSGLGIEGDTLVVTDKNEEVAVYERESGTWSLAERFSVGEFELSTSVEQASPVAISGNRFAVGAPRRGFGQDKVFTFSRDGSGNWSQGATIVPPNADFAIRFGRSIDLEGNRLVVGAPREPSGSSELPGNTSSQSAGAAYLFVDDSNGGWTFERYIKAPVIGSGDEFGDAVSLGDGIIAIVSPQDRGEPGDPEARNEDNPRGAVWVLEDGL